MNWEYCIVTDRNLISIRGSGKFSTASFEEMIRDVQSDEKWQPNMHRLLDFSSLDFTETTDTDIRTAADIHKRYDYRIGSGRIALVFGNEEDFGLGRMYETFLGASVQATVKSFRTADEASQWIMGLLSLTDGEERDSLAGHLMKYTDEEIRWVFDRTDGRCFYCGDELVLINFNSIAEYGAWEVGHFIPRPADKACRKENLTAACVRCIAVKGQRFPWEYDGARFRQGDEDPENYITK